MESREHGCHYLLGSSGVRVAQGKCCGGGGGGGMAQTMHTIEALRTTCACWSLGTGGGGGGRRSADSPQVWIETSPRPAPGCGKPSSSRSLTDEMGVILLGCNDDM